MRARQCAWWKRRPRRNSVISGRPGTRSSGSQQNAVARREEELKEAHDSLKKLKVAILDHEASVKSADQQIKRYEKKKCECCGGPMELREEPVEK